MKVSRFVVTAAAALAACSVLAGVVIANEAGTGFEDALLFDDFSTGLSGWTKSVDPMYNGDAVGKGGAMVLPEEARRYGLTRTLDSPVALGKKPLVLQYDVKFSKGHGCSGGYLKFLSQDSAFKAQDLNDQSPYSIMFGPDKCGDAGKVHLIFRYKSKKTGEIEEKHLSKPTTIPTGDFGTHVFKAVINPDNTYAIHIDDVVEQEGSIFEDFEPSFLPPKEIDDPTDSKPEDWVDEAEIPDPDATKPDDWDETLPERIPDEEAVKPDDWDESMPVEILDPEAEEPEDWDEEEDGEWEKPTIPNPDCADISGCGKWTPPLIPNPDYKGKWFAPYIDNPEYKGVWTPRKIPNPDYFEDDEPLKGVAPIGAVAAEIWAMDPNIIIDNVLVTNNDLHAKAAVEKFWIPKAEKEKVERAKAAAEENKHSHLMFWRNLIDNYVDPIAQNALPENAYYKFLDAKESVLSNLVYLYLVVGLTPTFLVIMCFKMCFRSDASPTSAPSDEDARRKKTDEAEDDNDDDDDSEDDDGVEEIEEEEEEEKPKVTRRRVRTRA